MTLFPAVMKALDERGAEDVAVFGGGIVPQDDVVALKHAGVKEIFTPGASTQSIVEWIRDNVHPREGVA
jgi:methylmalonyl-CoA mutase C-terminal domain/subunit